MEFLKKMFDFSIIKKLFSYNWKNVFNHLLPKGNKIVINDDEYQHVANGAILLAISTIISNLLMTIAGAIVLANNPFNKVLYGSNPFGAIFAGMIGLLILETILILLVPGAIFTYNMVMRKKEQNTWVYFIILCLTALCALGFVINIITWIVKLITVPLLAIFGLAIMFIEFMGIIHLLIGTIDICVDANTVNQNSENSDTKPNEKAKFCPNCGEANNGGKFCVKCGYKFE